MPKRQTRHASFPPLPPTPHPRERAASTLRSEIRLSRRVSTSGAWESVGVPRLVNLPRCGEATRRGRGAAVGVRNEFAHGGDDLEMWTRWKLFGRSWAAKWPSLSGASRSSKIVNLGRASSSPTALRAGRSNRSCCAPLGEPSPKLAWRGRSHTRRSRTRQPRAVYCGIPRVSGCRPTALGIPIHKDTRVCVCVTKR